MKNRTFIITLSAVLAVCLILSVFHAIYAFFAYNASSIIYFISQELW